MPSRLEHVLLAFSSGLNLLAIGVLSWVIKSRGGVAYLKSWLSHDSTANVDPAVIGRQTLFELLPSPGVVRPIVFMGDSLTASCEWREMFGSQSLILNRGIGGDTSAGAAIRADSIAALHPIAVFLMIGTNDPQMLRCSPEQTVSNWRTIVAAIQRKSPDTTIYLESLLPTFAPKFNHWSQLVNQQLPSLADGRSVVFVNLRPAFLSGDALNPNYTPDGIHLNGAGYLAWKRQIDTFIQELFRRQAPS
jgi:lysophospholipase L1-like esterase